MHKHISYTALIVALITLLIVLLHPSKVEQAPKHETAFERVMRTGTIRCGYALWYPEMMKDPNTGTLSGYDYDVVNAIGEILGLKVEWVEEIGWGVAQDGLATQRYDVACNGYWGPPARSKTVLFSVPFVHHPLYVVLNKKVVIQQKGVDWLNDGKYKLAIIRGAIMDVVAKEHFSKTQLVDAMELSNDGNVLTDVGSGKVDFTVSNAIAVQRYIEQNGNVTMLEPSVGIGSGALLLPADDFRLKHMIDAALSYMINSGQINVIMKKYMGDDSTAWLPPVPSYLPATKTDVSK